MSPKPVTSVAALAPTSAARWTFITAVAANPV